MLVSCSKDISTQQIDKLDQSPTFKYPVIFGDGKKGEYILIGETDKVAFQIGSGEKDKSIVNPIVEGKKDKYMWYFWGKDEDLKGEMRLEGISENGKKVSILTSSSLGIGTSPIKGANATLPSKILPVPCMKNCPYIYSEKRRTIKCIKKVDISMVLKNFVCRKYVTYEI